MTTPLENAEIVKKEFEGASDRAAAIVGCIFVDELLTELLKKFLVPDLASDKKIFEGSGPIATLSSKIDIAYRLGLITKIEQSTMHSIRSIRNVFAHQMGNASFALQSIRDQCSNISVPPHMLVPDFIPPTENGEAPPLPQVHKVENTDSRSVFQEAISHLMRVLAARDCEAMALKRNSPNDFTAAHEPILVVLSRMRDYQRQLLEGLEEAKATGSNQMGTVIQVAEEHGSLVQKFELYLQQIKAAHSK